MLQNWDESQRYGPFGLTQTLPCYVQVRFTVPFRSKTGSQYVKASVAAGISPYVISPSPTPTKPSRSQKTGNYAPLSLVTLQTSNNDKYHTALNNTCRNSPFVIFVSYHISSLENL